MLHAVIMAGGSGTRFWPASRAAKPKQLLQLAGEETMIQATVSRLEGLIDPAHVLVVTSERLLEPIQSQLPALSREAFLGEPCKRDTAPCVGLAAAWVCQQDPDAIMAVMPADHVIGTPSEFQAAIRGAVALVEEEPSRLVTFGIKPTYPAESFGYIEAGEVLGDRTYRVEQFREKPRVELAEQYLEAGNFFWNSGIFVWRAQTILDLLQEFEPEMAAHLARIQQSIGTPAFGDVLGREFALIDGKSIDYAVMERAPEVVVVEAPFDWDDVGSWTSLERLQGADASGNTVQGPHVAIDTTNCIVRGDGKHLIATVGVSDLIVVQTADATLVANRHDEEAVRKVVQQLQQQKADEHL